MVHIIENPPIPLSTPIYEGMRHHSAIEIHGDVYQGAQGGFTIEFPTYKGVAFHISVRMGVYGQNVIVFNHLDHGRWHREEHHHNHIQYGRPFHMKILNERRKYEVHLDGTCVGHYHHHTCPKKITMMTIRGDIRIGKIHFENFKHHNGGGTEVGINVVPVVASAPMQPAPIYAQPPPIPPPTPVYVQQPVVEVVQPVVQPIYPGLQPVVYPTATPVIYTQPEVIYMDGYRHHHHHHC